MRGYLQEDRMNTNQPLGANFAEVLDCLKRQNYESIKIRHFSDAARKFLLDVINDENNGLNTSKTWVKKDRDQLHQVTNSYLLINTLLYLK